VAACRRAGARFSITARLTPTVVAAITGIVRRIRSCPTRATELVNAVQVLIPAA
jgi:hypothetical protein